MAGVATLRLRADARHGSSYSFSFLAVALPQSGMVLDRAVDSEENLLSNGVDYQRWLRVFSQFPITDAVTISSCATYSAAIDLARQHLEASSRFADLTITYGSQTILHSKMKILSPVMPAARIGLVTGSGVSGSPLASVRTVWRWQCTQAG